MEQFSLRVSVGSLVKVTFTNPENNHTMLALERVATLGVHKGFSEVTVKTKPFGGGVMITNPKALKEHIGDFCYDSERSIEEKDFRILVHTESWEKINIICEEQLKDEGDRILDITPYRELKEEFWDSLKIKISRNHYALKYLGMITEDTPTETENVRAQGFPTVRIYYLFEAKIISLQVIEMMLANSKEYSDAALRARSWEDAKHEGKGRANAILTLDLEELLDVYRSIPKEKLGEPIYVRKHRLDPNVLAVLNEINSPKYKWHNSMSG